MRSEPANLKLYPSIPPDVRVQLISCYATLQSACFADAPDLLVWDADRIISKVAESLDTFEGLPEGFEAWATGVVSRETRRHVAALAIRTQYNRFIDAAIRSASSSTSEDAAVSHDDLRSEVDALLWAYADDLLTPGTAKTSTRIFSLVRRHVLNRTKKDNRRFRIATERKDDLRSGGVEFFSETELDSIAADDSVQDC